MPGLLAVMAPIFIGFCFGKEMLGGLFSRSDGIRSTHGYFFNPMPEEPGIMPKTFEGGVEIKGNMYYKGSDPHKAAVVGDTVGDPFKDTSRAFYQYFDQIDFCDSLGDSSIYKVNLKLQGSIQYCNSPIGNQTYSVICISHI